MSDKLNNQGYLETVVDPDLLKQLVGDTKDAQAALEAAGVQSKEKTPAPAEETPTPVAEEKKDVEEDNGVQAPDLAVLVKAIVAHPDFKKGVSDLFKLDDLNDFVAATLKTLKVVPAQQKAIEQLAKSEDEKIAEKIAPAVGQTMFAWEKRASQSEETVVDKPGAGIAQEISTDFLQALVQ